MIEVLKNDNENVIDFKSRKEQFKKWVNKVIDNNCTDETIEHAVFIFDRKDKNGKTKLDAARFNSTVEDFERFSTFLKDCILYTKIDDYLRHNIGDYLQYIE